MCKHINEIYPTLKEYNLFPDNSSFSSCNWLFNVLPKQIIIHNQLHLTFCDNFQFDTELLQDKMIYFNNG